MARNDCDVPQDPLQLCQEREKCFEKSYFPLDEIKSRSKVYLHIQNDSQLSCEILKPNSLFKFKINFLNKII